MTQIFRTWAGEFPHIMPSPPHGLELPNDTHVINATRSQIKILCSLVQIMKICILLVLWKAGLSGRWSLSLTFLSSAHNVMLVITMLWSEWSSNRHYIFDRHKIKSLFCESPNTNKEWGFPTRHLNEKEKFYGTYASHRLLYKCQFKYS